MAASLTTRTSKGAALSWAEMDANLNGLNAEIIGLEASAPISVRDYGAVGDGVIDDTAAIQAALNAGSSRTVYFPPGVYKITDTLLVLDACVVKGAGIGVSILSATNALSSTDAMLYANGKSQVQVLDLSFVGNTNGTLGAGFGIFFELGANNVVSRCYVTDTTQTGIRLSEQTYCTISNNWLVDCGRDGFSDNHGIMLYTTTVNPCHGVKITDNVLTGTYRKGITTYAPTTALYDVLISGNTVTGSGLGGIYVGGPLHKNIRIIGNHCADCYVCIQFGAGADSVISGNTCDSPTGAFAIGLWGTSRTSITSNVVKNSAMTGMSFFSYLSSTNEQLVISDNIVQDSNRTDAGYAGIELVSTSNSLVRGNIVSDDAGAILQTYGIYENTGSDNNTIAGNKVSNYTTGQYFQTGTGTIIDAIGWRDLIGDINVKGTAGANTPTWSAVTGLGGLFAYRFDAGTMNEVWITYHIDHDYAPGTAIYLHTHWLNSAATPNTGNVRWGFEYTVAKGHQQQAFSAPTTVYVTQACNSTRYMHHIAEVSLADAVPATNLEPDSLIMVRIFRDAADGADTCTDAVHLLLADCHYQSDRASTKDKAPNFYL